MTRARLGFVSFLMLLGCPAGDADDGSTDGGTDASDSVDDDGDSDDDADDDGDDDDDSGSSTSSTGTTSSTQSSTSDDTTDPSTDTSPTSVTTSTSTTATTVDETTESGGSSDSSTGTPVDQTPPMGAELLAWLQAGEYLGWTTESGPHPSAGPHFGTVRTFVNDTMFDSLTDGNATHTVGGALVKELYGDSTEVGGWAVMTKVQDAAGGSSWYWYEWYEGSTFADGVGVNGCVGCHSRGDDHVRSPFPLQ